LHVPWDESGCLCSVGDLFNYLAPGKELSCIDDVDYFLSNSSVHVTALSDGEQIDFPFRD